MVTTEKGTISIHTENIFPIIKKFLYSDHEIFLRELVSNGVDAIQKLKRLSSLGQVQGELGDLRVSVSIDKEAKTITVSDTGIGMTADEVKKYINQIAFSGAKEFVEKYKNSPEAAGQIIGHFGLGFYSAFMVARLVEINTLSHEAGAEPAFWRCDGSTEFELSQGTRTERGTDIILHLADDSLEFLEAFRLQQILDKYCRFLPVEVWFEDKAINDTKPLWTRRPQDLTDEDYIQFYKDLYHSYEEPLFWIHINVQDPFELTGILYFPKIKPDLEPQRNKIQLYSRQVFITDEVKDVVPEFLMLLHGVLDSPDIPLNVSRSYLQADGRVKAISKHITKKVADKLNELYKNDRENYEAKWESLSLFVKYGMITNNDFADRARNFVLLESTSGKLHNIDEYKEQTQAAQTDKDGKLIWLYAASKEAQNTYIAAAGRRGYDVLLLDHIIDNHFAQHLEQKVENTLLRRVDADTLDKLIAKEVQAEVLLSDGEKETITDSFKQALDKSELELKFEALSAEDLPVILTEEEWSRRFREMYATQGGLPAGMDKRNFNIVINGNHPLVEKIAKAEDGERRQRLARHAYDLALLSQNQLTGAELTAFIERSLGLLD